jgi:protein O-GlcNAc transferase
MNRKQRRTAAKLNRTQSDPRAGTAIPVDSSVIELLAAGLQHLRAGRLAEAEASYRRVLAAQPGHSDALHLLGIVVYQMGRHERGVELIRQAIQRNGQRPTYFCDLGVMLKNQRKLDEAIAEYRRAIAIKPDLAEAHYNLGNALKDQGKRDEAIAAYRRTIAIKPNLAETHYNLGNALHDQGKLEEALASYERALAEKPDHAYAFSGAAACVMRLCNWDSRTRFAADVNAHVSGKKSIIYPFVLLNYNGDSALQLQCARNYIENEVPLSPRPFWAGQNWRHDKLRVAYLSADFRIHPVAHLTAELYELHNRSRFEIFGVSFGIDDSSEMRKRLVAAFDEFHDVRRMSDQEIAKLLYDRQVDVAIDLTGYTRGSRPGIFAHRPAPIQVSYLGYPGTMGTPFIDYIIADKVVAPFEQQQFYTEKIVHLPDCYLVNDSKRKIAESAPTRREMGLPENAFVFCCFNNNWKITPAIFDVWMRLLHQVEGGVLWLYRDNEGAERNLRKEAQRREIDPSRLVFATRLSLDAHLARHRLADLFLDTLPYNAHTTTSDALWAGLPVLTCKGEAFAGRVAASLLHAVGIPELITPNLEDYQALALKLAREPELLAGVKAKLAANRDTYPLFDTVRFTRHIEAAYTTMWETWQHGEAPKSFSVEPIEGSSTLKWN